LQQELDRPVSEVFSSISPAPIAAASLGQVYRATLRSNGADVAIKVQRPGVLELVALDLVLGRKGIEIAGALFPDTARAKDILPVLDEWAFKLYREMDYRREASVMEQFASDLADLQGIMVPASYAEATTRRVLCTQWIEGEKLSESNADDVRQLCTTLLNAYLIQLLDTGLLHAGACAVGRCCCCACMIVLCALVLCTALPGQLACSGSLCLRLVLVSPPRTPGTCCLNEARCLQTLTPATSSGLRMARSASLTMVRLFETSRLQRMPCAVQQSTGQLKKRLAGKAPLDSQNAVK
jgi:hypothetical protein